MTLATWPVPEGPDRATVIRARAASLALERPQIQYGTEVLVRTAFDEELPKVATSGIVAGGDFPVVWVRRADRPDGEAVPWPAEDVRITAI